MMQQLDFEEIEKWIETGIQFLTVQLLIHITLEMITHASDGPKVNSWGTPATATVVWLWPFFQE